VPELLHRHTCPLDDHGLDFRLELDAIECLLEALLAADQRNAARRSDIHGPFERAIEPAHMLVHEVELQSVPARPFRGEDVNW
jgi:hypothetical protein